MKVFPLQRFSLVALAVILVACAGSMVGVKYLSPENPHTPAIIEVSKPLVVGFFPTVAQPDEHLPFALEDTAKCLEKKRVEVMAVQADILIFRDGQHEFRLELSD